MPEGPHKPVGITVAKSCMEAELCQDAPSSRDFEPVCRDDEELNRFMTPGFRIKAGARHTKTGIEEAALAENLASRGAGLIIGGRAEIPLVQSEPGVRGIRPLPAIP